jgi:pimeloyl-ACP methyl ester carboxylesterase/class 3 adenylate cyclase
MPCPGDLHYARTRDGIDIAYTVFGEGPDMLVSPGFVTHMDFMWDLPPFEVISGFGRNFRTIVFDKRGTGLSDRTLGFGSLEDRAEDIRAVLDAVGSEQAVLYGISESGPMATYFTAQHPERVRALMLQGTTACFEASGRVGLDILDEDGTLRKFKTGEEFLDILERDWGKGLVYQSLLSSPPDPVAARRVLMRYERNACTPLMARQIMERNFDLDVRPLLGLISVPTLVVHCTGDPAVPVELARELAAGIPNAKYVEIDGDFHGSWRREDNAKIGHPIRDFLMEVFGGGTAGAAATGVRELATVLFTDIVGSTERASELGDTAWAEILARHESTAAEIVPEHGGRLVKTTGDGLLATFAGPSGAVVAARALQEAAVGFGVGVRAGVHTGEIERLGDDIGGIGVHIASRISSLAGAGELLVSRTVRDLAVGSRYVFEDRGAHTLKGVPDSWQLFAVV